MGFKHFTLYIGCERLAALSCIVKLKVKRTFPVVIGRAYYRTLLGKVYLVFNK